MLDILLYRALHLKWINTVKKNAHDNLTFLNVHLLLLHLKAINFHRYWLTPCPLHPLLTVSSATLF